MVDKIIVLDFGSQYTHLLARRIRQLNVYSEIKDPLTATRELREAKGVILSGGPKSVYDVDAPRYNKELFSLNIPILGLCYGHHLLAKSLGGEVERGEVREYGIAELEIKEKGQLFEGLSGKETVWMSHGDKVSKLPEGFKTYASTRDCKYAAIADEGKKRYGLQFHPEVTHTAKGMEILENFALKICKAKAKWTIENYMEDKVGEIKEKVREKNVFMLVSGGVDSTVCLVLLDKALGHDKVYALHVDTGFMRKDESKKVKGVLDKLGLKELHVIDAGNEFFDKLERVADPEEKREVIGNLFIELANKEIGKLGLDPDEWILGQGTIYPDTIETSGTPESDKIKTHHNRVEFVKELLSQGRVIEPLNQLYKDEVRELGLELGLPREVVMRHPFPGPGLAIRALCSGSGEEMIPTGIEKPINKISAKHGYNARVLPVKAVGVQVDARTYSNVVALSGKRDWDKLEKVSTKITNAVKGVNRVVFLLYPEAIKSVKLLENRYLTKERIESLREADTTVMSILEKENLMDNYWQFPIVLLPVGINSDKESICLRPVLSKEAMTARFAEIRDDVLDEIVLRIMQSGEIGAVSYDITHKPPATIEWE